VQLVGIYLVFASLILPALAARRYAPRLRLMVGYLTGLGGYLAGLVLSAMFDLPTGAVIVVTLLLAMIVAALASLAAPVSARAPAGAEPAASSG
jgi:zinc/manganese transport system permease protein